MLAVILLPSRWGEGDHRYKTSQCRNLCNLIAMVEGAYLCLCLFIFCCISEYPLTTNHSSPTTRFMTSLRPET